MSYGYGNGRQNPYDQREGGSQGGYGGSPQQYGGSPQQYGGSSPGYGRNAGPAMGRDDYAGQNPYATPSHNVNVGQGQNVEMASLAQNGSQFGRGSDPNAILNECREIDKGIDEIKASLANLATLQNRSLIETDSSAQSQTNRQLDAISSETMGMYRNFAGRIKAIKQQRESGTPKNAPQVGKVDRKLKAAIQEYQSMDSQYRKKLQEQMARQYRIVRPDASEAEVREAVEDTSSQQVFSQALLQSDRRGQARAALSAVENRHAAIQKIESQMIELAELFQDMEALVVQQEEAVTQIEMKGEEVVENMDKGTQELGTAIQSAKNARKWKWWCLGICVLIIIIIVIVILIWKFVINNNGSSKKRDLSFISSISARRVISPFTEASPHTKRFVVPGLEWKGARMVKPGVAWTGEKRAIAFSA